MIVLNTFTLEDDKHKLHMLYDNDNIDNIENTATFGTHIKQLFEFNNIISRNIKTKYFMGLYSIKCIETEEFNNIEELKHKYMHKLI
jgi:hypothetical protein